MLLFFHLFVTVSVYIVSIDFGKTASYFTIDLTQERIKYKGRYTLILFSIHKTENVTLNLPPCC
jgi:hypothetical protein